MRSAREVDIEAERFRASLGPQLQQQFEAAWYGLGNCIGVHTRVGIENPTIDLRTSRFRRNVEKVHCSADAG